MADSQTLLVVIATYMEMQNLPELVDKIFKHQPNASIFVIDDNSTDGTGDWCQRMASEQPAFQYTIRESKLGLGTAAIEGFQFGLENKFELIATMDGDLSHSPADLPTLVAELLRQGADVVIGSRYVAGGKIEGWPWHRRIASRMVNFLSRWWLGLRSRDNSGAFRVYKTETLKRINVDSLSSTGYGYLEEILLRIQRSGSKIAEIPIAFRNREHGQSKTSLGVGIQKIWRILLLRFAR